MSENKFSFDRDVFSHTNKVDLLVLDPTDPLERVATIAEEHGFRSISVPLIRVPELQEIRKSSETAEYNIVAMADFPFGSSPEYIRKCMCVYAHESGADEIEISSPYCLIQQKDMASINQDIKTILSICQKVGLVPRIAVEAGSDFFTDITRSRFMKILSSNKVKNLLFYNSDREEDINHSTNIIDMRNLRYNKSVSVKAQLGSLPIETMSMYPKAGAKYLGLPWREAANLVHEYEEMIQAYIDSQENSK